MVYSNIEKLNAKPSLLGFGCMRFPTSDGKIDEAKAQAMLDKAYESGITYYDTAYPYHDGESENFVGRAMKKYDRSSYYLATKLPTWLVNSVEDAERLFEEQLKKLQTDYFDFYLIHALDKERWHKMAELGIPEFGERLKAAGKVRYFGFSFHDSKEAFKEIIDARDWDFCQIQLNYMDIEDGPGLDGYDYAEKKGVPLVIMEPVKGGLLANLPKDIADKLKTVNSESSSAAWALRWIAGKPNVKVVLSGMTTMEQLEDNLVTFDDFKPLSAEEETALEEAAATIKSRVRNGCTGCRYCMPCPMGVDIPQNFSIWNRYGMFENAGDAKYHYTMDLSEGARADKCVKCGKCETKCPQHLPIREQLQMVAEEMGKLL